MLFRKKEKETKKPVKNTEPYVCKTCGCLVHWLRVKEVSEDGFLVYYCAACAPPYDKAEHGIMKKEGSVWSGPLTLYFIRRPAYDEEVDKKGKPLKKKK